METSLRDQGETILSLDFDSSYRKLFVPLLGSGVASQGPSGAVTSRLREVFKDASREGGREVNCLRCPQVGPCRDGEAAVVMETKSDYNLLRSLEILGGKYTKDRQYQGAYNCYKLACSYYEDRFDPRFVKCREMKKKMARVLLKWGQFERVIEELKADVEEDAYCTLLSAECTVYIKYAYGRSLLHTNSSLEAVPYLFQNYLAYMNIEKWENMEVLYNITQIIIEQLSKERAELAMNMTNMLLNIFSIRLHRGDCPAEIFDFAATLSSHLRRGEREVELISIYDKARELESKYRTRDTSLLLSTIGCSFPEESTQFENSLEYVGSIHRQLLSEVAKGDMFTIRRLKVTTKLIYIFSTREEATNMLSDTFKLVSGVLGPKDPYYKYFRDYTDESVWTKQ